LSSDLRKSAVHVLRRDVDAASPPRKLCCHRCARDLPVDQFGMVDFGTDRNIVYLHPFCWTCRKQLNSPHKEHSLYSPSLHRYLSRLTSSARGGARARGLVFAIDADDVLGRFLAQNGRCALTGMRMSHRHGTRQDRAWGSASIDRRDNNRNYTLDNIHLVCRAVNIMKNDMTLEEFGAWCKRVVVNALSVKKK